MRGKCLINCTLSKSENNHVNPKFQQQKITAHLKKLEIFSEGFAYTVLSTENILKQIKAAVVALFLFFLQALTYGTFGSNGDSL